MKALPTCLLLQGYYSQTQSSRDCSAEVFTSSSSSSAGGDGTTGVTTTASASSNALKVHTVTPGNVTDVFKSLHLHVQLNSVHQP
jgi:hypothetical protein